MKTTVLFRPVGDIELALIRESNWLRFPPRLPEQPIFYPVLEEEYAIQIARDWNARGTEKGHVLRFEVDSDYLQKFTIQVVGSKIHREYWIPAEELETFNSYIFGQIECIATFAKD